MNVILKPGDTAGEGAMNRFRFSYIARKLAVLSGRPATFLVASGAVVLWALSGPIFHFSDTWQLVINTSTTIVTFLMVFLIQNTQNREAKASQLKLDELIRAVTGARNIMVNVEDLSDAKLAELRQEFQRLGIAAE